MKRLCIYILIMTGLVGCSTNKSELMLQKNREKKLNLSPNFIRKSSRYSKDLVLKPSNMTLVKEGVSIYVEYLNSNVLEKFFNNEERFGDLADSNPYFPDFLVFYIKITNESGKVIHLDPKEFVILDDLHGQYSCLDSDYIISLYKARSSVYSITQSTDKFTPGGFYGAPIDVATSLAGKSIAKRSIQLKTVELSGGYVYDGVIYDGLISFLKPPKDSSKIKLLLPDIKIKANPDDETFKSVTFTANFDIISSEDSKEDS